MKSYLTILKLVWPLALGMMNSAVMQFTDRAFLAHESMKSLEAVLPASSLAMVVISFFYAVVAYSGTFVAGYFGAKDRRMCVASYRAGVQLALVAGLITLLTVPVGLALLSFASHAPDVLSRERLYYGIFSSGAVFLYLQMAVSSYFTGLGRTGTVLVANLIGVLANVFLDPILIFGFGGCPRLGISGAALASVLAMALQGLVLSLQARRETAGVAALGWKDQIGLIRRIVRYGVPSGGYNVMSLLSFSVFVFMTGTVGDVELAVSNTCLAVNYLLFAPVYGFSFGASTVVAQALGRKDFKGAKAAGTRTVVLGVVFIAFVSALMLAFNRPLLLLFAPDDPAQCERFLSLGFVLFVMMAAWQVFDATDIILAGALKGAGDTRFVMLLMLVASFAVWIPLAVLMRHFHNTLPALWSTMLVYVAVLFVASLVRWRGNGFYKASDILV